MYTTNNLFFSSFLFTFVWSFVLSQSDPVSMASIQFSQTMVKEEGLSKKQCAKACVSETRFNCKYFRYITGVGTCYLAIEEHIKKEEPEVKDDIDSQTDLFQERLSNTELQVRLLGKKLNKLEEMEEKLADLKIMILKESKKRDSFMNQVRKASMNQEESLEMLAQRLKHLESKDKSNFAIVETFREMVSDIERQNTLIRAQLKALAQKIRDLMTAWSMISSEMKSMNIDIVGMSRKILETNNKDKELDNRIETVRNEGIKRSRKLSQKILDVEKVEKELLNSDSLEGRLKRIETQVDALSTNTAVNAASLEELESLKSLHSNSRKTTQIQKEITEMQNSLFELESKQENLEHMLLMGHLIKTINTDKHGTSSSISANLNLIPQSQKNDLFKAQNEEAFDKPENSNKNHFVMAISHAGSQHVGEDGRVSHVQQSKFNIIHMAPQNEANEEPMPIYRDPNRCPTGWYKSTTRCLIFLPEMVDYSEAKTSCGIRGGELAVANNLDQWKSVRIFLAIHSNLSSSVWLSSGKRHSEGDVDCENDCGHMRRSSVSFHPRSVSVKLHVIHAVKEANCLVMEPSKKFSIEKVFCNSQVKHATVCERQLPKGGGDKGYETLLSRIKHASDNQFNTNQNQVVTSSIEPSSLSSTTTSSGTTSRLPNIMVVRDVEHTLKKRNPLRRIKTCPSFGQKVNGLCLKFISSEQLVTKALSTCKGMGGYLVTVENVQSQIALEKFLLNLGIFQTIWMSPSISSDGEVWVWESTRRPVIYNNYLSGRPDTENRHRCNQMRKEWTFKWLDKYCSDSKNNEVRHPFVCQF